MLAKYLGDLCQERRATRGLAAAARLQVRTDCLYFLDVLEMICLPLHGADRPRACITLHSAVTCFYREARTTLASLFMPKQGAEGARVIA